MKTHEFKVTNKALGPRIVRNPKGRGVVFAPGEERTMVLDENVAQAASQSAAAGSKVEIEATTDAGQEVLGRAPRPRRPKRALIDAPDRIEPDLTDITDPGGKPESVDPVNPWEGGTAPVSPQPGAVNPGFGRVDLLAQADALPAPELRSRAKAILGDKYPSGKPTKQQIIDLLSVEPA